MTIEVTEDMKQQASALYQEHGSVNKVAKLMGIDWKITKSLCGAPSKPKSRPRKAQEPDEDAGFYDLPITLHGDCFDRILMGLSMEEKAEAVRAVIILRLNSGS